MLGPGGGPSSCQKLVMHPIFVNIQPYLDDVEEETSMLNGARERATSVPSASRDAVERWIYVNAIASGIEKVYIGIEKVLDRGSCAPWTGTRRTVQTGTLICFGVYRSTCLAAGRPCSRRRPRAVRCWA